TPARIQKHRCYLAARGYDVEPRCRAAPRLAAGTAERSLKAQHLGRALERIPGTGERGRSFLRKEVGAQTMTRNPSDPTCSRARSMFSAESSLPTLKAISVLTQKECVRFGVSALVRSGVDPKDICTLRDVCMPSAFERALDYLALQLGGPTRTVENVAIVLAK